MAAHGLQGARVCCADGCVRSGTWESVLSGQGRGDGWGQEGLCTPHPPLQNPPPGPPRPKALASLCASLLPLLVLCLLPSCPLLYSPEGVGRDDEDQGDHMVDKHDHRVLAPGIHVQRGIDGMAIEASVQQVGGCDVPWHCHAWRPVWGEPDGAIRNPQSLRDHWGPRDISRASSSWACKLHMPAMAPISAGIMDAGFPAPSVLSSIFDK